RPSTPSRPGRLVPAKLAPTAPTHVPVMWDGVTENIVGGSIVVRRVSRVVTVVAVKVRGFRGRWVSPGGWAAPPKRKAAAKPIRADLVIISSVPSPEPPEEHPTSTGSSQT